MLPGAHRQTHQRASGWVIYWYAWRGGPQIGLFRGATLGEAEHAEAEGAPAIAAAWAAERRPKPPEGVVAAAITAFYDSAEWRAFAPKTQKAWERWLEVVRVKWGHLSGDEFASDDTATLICSWRDDLAKASPANADKAMEAVSRMCSWARHRSRKRLPITCKPTDGLGKAYTRPVQLPPSRAAVLDAIASLPPLASVICEIAVHSGLRRSDLALLSDVHVDEEAGIVRLGTQKGKRQRRVAVIRLTPPLLAAVRKAQGLRDARYEHICADRRRRGRADPARPLAIIVNTHAEAFTANGLYQHVRKAFEGVAKTRINPHAFRRASATQKYLNGMSWAQIGRELGWGEDEAEKMGAIYVPDEAVAPLFAPECEGRPLSV